MKKSRKKTILTCLDCGLVIKGGAHLSRHVKQIHNYTSYDEYKIKYELLKTKEELKTEGAVSCKLCNMIAHDLTSHIFRTHKLSPTEYKKMYGDIRSKKYNINQSERVLGDKNPAYNHGGKYSPFSDKFIYADKIDKNKISKKVSESNKNNGNNSTTISYWTKLGYSELDAKKKISERQKTFTLEKCIEKYGEEKGRERWLNRQEKWMISFKKSRKNGFSKISQTLFWEIYDNLNTDKNYIYFAELGEDKLLDDSGHNNEYKLKLPQRVLWPDFINIKTNRIIEFDGTYWHGEKMIQTPNKLRDDERDAILIQNNYKIMHVKEHDYRVNKNKVIKECLEFLNG
jgi:Protein of unknown function (DUF559)